MNEIKKVWGNPKYKALIKLGGWFVFFLLIVLMCYLPGGNTELKAEKTPIKEKENFKSLDDLKNNLLLNNYKYSYKLNSLVNQTLIVFNGELNEGTDSGYYESKTEIFKYSCTLEKCYKVFTDHKEEYELENYPLYFLTFIFEFIKDAIPEVAEENNVKIYKYNIDVQGDNWEVIIKTSIDDIVSINFNTQKEIYEFNVIK